MIGPLAAHLLYALAWGFFGASHSVLAAEGAKRSLGVLFGAGYRLAYNLFAVIAFALVLAAGWWLLGHGVRFAWPRQLGLGLAIVEAAGWIVLIVGLRGYDLGRLAGSFQLEHRRRTPPPPEDEELRFDGLHAYVRHPLYAAGFLVLWGRVETEFDLATALWGSLYLLVGTRLEERKLVRRYGPRYVDYRERVPAYLPWKGRALTRRADR
jgi:protein-S-isoprenylcysteine O-methyltransferase Ste14